MITMYPQDTLVTSAHGLQGTVGQIVKLRYAVCRVGQATAPAHHSFDLLGLTTAPAHHSFDLLGLTTVPAHHSFDLLGLTTVPADHSFDLVGLRYAGPTLQIHKFAWASKSCRFLPKALFGMRRELLS